MAKGQLQTVLDHFRGLVTAEQDCPLPDEQLLDRFVTDRDEAAFAALFYRHGAMVLGVCLRLLRDPHDAEDACQATFLVLARKAASVRKRQALGSWLHGVAYRVAGKLRAELARRCGRQVPLADVPVEDPAGELTWREVRAVLDEEVDRLPEVYRAPLVLCYLEGRTHDEAARELGWTLYSLRGRLERARLRLRNCLAGRGVTLPAALLGAALTPGAGPAALPPTLVVATVKAASLAAAGKTVGTALLLPEVAVITERVVRSMFLAKLKVAAAVLLGVGLLSAGTAGVAYRALAEQRQVHAAGAPEGRSREKVPVPAGKVERSVPLAGALPLKFDQEIRIAAQSRPVKMAGQDLHIVGIGRGAFHLGKDSRLTAKLFAAVAQYARVDYWIHVAVFDAKGQLLGAASHKEEVEYIRLGKMPTALREIEVDFGVSRDFKNAAYVTVSVSNPEVPITP